MITKLSFRSTECNSGTVKVKDSHKAGPSSIHSFPFKPKRHLTFFKMCSKASREQKHSWNSRVTSPNTGEPHFAFQKYDSHSPGTGALGMLILSNTRVNKISQLYVKYTLRQKSDYFFPRVKTIFCLVHVLKCYTNFTILYIKYYCYYITR